MMDPVMHNVIIFGEAGSGKSSIINMIVGETVAKVSNSPVGCTFKTERYEASFNGAHFYIYDTAGLNEGEHGRVPHWGAVRQVYTLLRTLDGVSLLIYCIRGRVKANTLANWVLFSKVLCNEKVPIIAVETGLEWEDNVDGRTPFLKAALEEYGIIPTNVVCIVSALGAQDQYKEKYEWSRIKLRSCINDSCRREPWSLQTSAWINHLYRTSTTTKFLGLSGEVQVEMEGVAIDELMQDTGLKESDFDKLKATLLDAERKLRKKGLTPEIVQRVSHNVIIFGESGSGKSSIVNMIAGEPVAGVSNSPVGCTFKTERYEASFNGAHFYIYDTAGLNEGDHGRVPHWDAVRELYTLIRTLDGVSLLIYCVRGRLKENALANWMLFNKVLCNERVPAIVVETGLDQEDDLDGRRSLLKDILEKNGIVPKEVACVVSIPGKKDEYREQYEWSQVRLRSFIKEFHKRNPWSLATSDWIAHIYITSTTTRLCGLVSKIRLEIVGIVFDKLIQDAGLKGDSKKLKDTLVAAEKKLRKQGYE